MNMEYMNGQFTIGLTFLVVCLILPSSAKWDPLICQVDDDGTNESLERCLRKADNFRTKYLQDLIDKAEGRRRSKRPFETCGEFAKVEKCMKPRLDSCPAMEHRLHSHWKKIYETLSCACSKSPECLTPLQCFEEQYYNDLGKLCDDRYRFNIKQRTRHRCHFIHDHVRCKESLITSACGEEAGTFAYHMLKLGHKSHIDKHKCELSREIPHQGFRYTNECRSDFIDQMVDCKDKMPDESKMSFLEANDLVPDMGKKGIKKACREFRDYETCMAPIKESCPEGTDLIYQFDADLRRYILKLSYICNEKTEEYLIHRPCYHSVLKNGTLRQCDKIFETVTHLLDIVSSHEFYCLSTTETSIALQTSLDDLKDCYQKSFTEVCGEEGGGVIGELMSRVFRDPYYLHYIYKPDCELHLAPPTEYPPTRPPRKHTKKKKVPTATLR